MSPLPNGWFMKMLYLNAILMVYFASTSGFPSRPLNERPPDLTWEAWLLVDENQNKHTASNADGTLRRRITPKSVFIAPTFSPESLPACADGYSSDPMGRCIKIIKLDEEAHYDFIIKNLEDKFGSFDYEDEEKIDEIIATPPPGPLQFNIPLSLDKDDTKIEDSEEETDIAIVVAPTKPIFDIKQLNFNKRDSLVDDQQQELLLKQLAGGIGDTTTTEKTTTTTLPETTTIFVKEELASTTPKVEELSTVIDIGTTSVNKIEGSDDTWMSTEVEDEITTPTDMQPVETTTDAASTTDPVVTVITDPVVTEYKLTTQSPAPIDIQNDAQIDSTSSPPTSSPNPEVTTKTFVRFPDQQKSHQHLDNSYVRFPDSEFSYHSQIPSSIETREVQDFGVPGFYRQKQSEKPIVFRDSPSSQNTNAGYSDVDVSNKAVRWEFNRRNRDKNSSVFMLPPKWNPSTFQKPLVLRFSRKHAFMDSDFKNPTYYRSIPSDDFAYLFKFKQKRIRR